MNLRSLEQFIQTVKGQNDSNLPWCFLRRHQLENKPLISNILFQVLLVVERKNKIGRNDWRRDIKKILSTKIHTYMEEMPRKVKKFSRKKFQTAKKNENRLLLSY